MLTCLPTFQQIASDSSGQLCRIPRSLIAELHERFGILITGLPSPSMVSSSRWTIIRCSLEGGFAGNTEVCSACCASPSGQGAVFQGHTDMVHAPPIGMLVDSSPPLPQVVENAEDVPLQG